MHFQFLDKHITEQSSAFRPSDATGLGDLEVETDEHLSLQMLVPTTCKYSGDEDPSPLEDFLHISETLEIVPSTSYIELINKKQEDEKMLLF